MPEAAPVMMATGGSLLEKEEGQDDGAATAGWVGVPFVAIPIAVLCCTICLGRWSGREERKLKQIQSAWNQLALFLLV